MKLDLSFILETKNYVSETAICGCPTLMKSTYIKLLKKTEVFLRATRSVFAPVIWLSSWTQEDLTETSIAFLWKKKSENWVFVGLTFLALDWGV